MTRHPWADCVRWGRGAARFRGEQATLLVITAQGALAGVLLSLRGPLGTERGSLRVRQPKARR